MGTAISNGKFPSNLVYMLSMEERLQKIMASYGIASRRQAELLITKGKVTVNGSIIKKLGTKVDPKKDKIAVDGKLLAKPKLVYYKFHKPVGVVTTLHDEFNRKSISEFIKDIPERVFPVGRLDVETSGLLLLTNDGTLANTITHPKYELPKSYLAIVNGIPNKMAIETLELGVVIQGRKTSEAVVKILKKDNKNKTAQLHVTIHEGRNRQIRRMLGQAGYPVIGLTRLSIGPITMGRLKAGECKPLTGAELTKLRTGETDSTA